MMENYDPNIIFGIHTVKITLQQWGYIGHIILKIGGNCRGRDVLNIDFEDGVNPVENDCEMEYHEDNDGYYSIILRNKEGDTLKGSYSPQEMNQLVVAVEIIDFTPVG